MLCKFVQNNLSAYLDEETGRVKNYIISGHLKSCEDCRKKLEFLQCVAKLTKKKESFKLSRNFVSGLRVKIAETSFRQERKLQHKMLPEIRLALSAASLVIIVVGGILIFNKPSFKNEYPLATLSYQAKGGAVQNESKGGVEFANIMNQTRRW